MHSYHVSRVIVVLLLVHYGTQSRFERAKVKYVVPTHSNHSFEAKSNNYNTLNDWISNGPNELFANNTKIVLCSGVHEIQLSKTHILIKDIKSFMMTGQNIGDTLITCNKMFYFHFNYFGQKYHNIKFYTHKLCLYLE